jgi:hypothetical protein
MEKSATSTRWSGTDTTPAVSFDQESGVLSISGCSIMENADRFYSPLLDLIADYGTRPAPGTTIHIRLTYFNSSSSKYLLDVLKELEDLHHAGNSTVRLVWHHASGDLDMKEAGLDYASLLDFSVDLIED